MVNSMYCNVTIGLKGECNIDICGNIFFLFFLGGCVDNSFIIIREIIACIYFWVKFRELQSRHNHERISDIVGRQTCWKSAAPEEKK